MSIYLPDELQMASGPSVKVLLASETSDEREDAATD